MSKIQQPGVSEEKPRQETSFRRGLMLVAFSFCLLLAAGCPKPIQTRLDKTIVRFEIPGFIDLDAGRKHTCGVDTSNYAYCWGNNAYGQLGTGSIPDMPCPAQPSLGCQPTPVGVQGGFRFKRVSAGGDHTCGLTTNDDVMCWGRNHKGQLGNGSTIDSRTPAKVIHPQGVSFTMVSAGGNHTCALDSQNWVFCWGDNSSAQLDVLNLTGCPVTTTHDGCSATPVLQGTGTSHQNGIFFEVSAGESHTCASNLSSIQCWGDNEYGQLGIGSSGPATGGAAGYYVVGGSLYSYASNSPGSTFGPSLSAGRFHTCALREIVAGKPKGADCWGLNYDGQLGGDLTMQPQPFTSAQPAKMPSGDFLWGTSAGDAHTCALWQDVVLNQGQPMATAVVPVCAGSNSQGQLGILSVILNNSKKFVSVPLPKNPDPGNFFKVTVGGSHSCALNITGRLTSTPGGQDYFGSAFCWGDNSYGQTGQGYVSSPTIPHLITNVVPKEYQPS